ncbi:MAG: hypothetical protein IJS53_02905, partial [Clostridia bacterium]|nr:hypothetical protein [Clostridia bacterium]
MKRKLIPLMLALLLLAACPFPAARAEGSGMNPPDELWGMSKKLFTTVFQGFDFSDRKINGQTVLSLSSTKVANTISVDAYFTFDTGRSDGELCGILYLIPMKDGGFNKATVTRYYNRFLDILTSQNGKPKTSAADKTTWEKDGFSITLARGSYEKYNNSAFETVGVTYTKTGASGNSANPKGNTFTVFAFATCADANHVGNEWIVQLSCDELSLFQLKDETFIERAFVFNARKCTLKAGDSITVSIMIMEEDKYSDLIMEEDEFSGIITESLEI